MGLGATSPSALAACKDPQYKSLTFRSEPLLLLIHEHIRSLVDDIEERCIKIMDSETQLPTKISAIALILGGGYFDGAAFVS